MLNNPVGWFEIYVDDMARAKTFYENVFGIRLSSVQDPNDEGFEMLAFPSNEDEYGASGALVHFSGMEAGGNSTIVYFSCRDCAHEEAKVEDAGGKIDRPKMSIGEFGFVSMVIDTEGNCIGLHSLQ